MSRAARLVRAARVDASLTQRELAERLETTQPAIARLERAGSNPRVDTLEEVLRAAGHRLDLSGSRIASGVDETLIASQLRLTPHERLAAFSSSHQSVRQLLSRARPLH